MFPLSQRQTDRQADGEEEEEEEQRIQPTRMLADDRSQQRALIAEFYYEGIINQSAILNMKSLHNPSSIKIQHNPSNPSHFPLLHPFLFTPIFSPLSCHIILQVIGMRHYFDTSLLPAASVCPLILTCSFIPRGDHFDFFVPVKTFKAQLLSQVKSSSSHAVGKKGHCQDTE